LQELSALTTYLVLHAGFTLHGILVGVTLFDTIILGIVEGLTEFLPVSSTGHMNLARYLLGIDAADTFANAFEVIIQLGAILAVVVLYWPRLVRDLEAWKRIIAAFIPTGLIAFALRRAIETYQSNVTITVVMTVGVGIILVLADRLTVGRARYSDINQVPLGTAALIGLVQAFSVIPGTSRSGASILGGMFLGLNRMAAAEFSFLLAIPTMIAASGYKFATGSSAFTSQEWGLLAIGFVISFVIAIVSIRFMLSLLPRYGFAPFGWYRIALGLLYAAFFLR